MPHTISQEVGECPTVHVGMVVASGGIGSRELYMTVKSVLMHRSTPLHFHFFTDDRAKTVLQTMLDTWLLPGIAHSYYDLREALQSVRLADSVVHCSQTLSIHLNLHLILPKSVSHIVVIEPTSVARVDLAQLWSVTVSREDHMTSLCQTACVTYCSVGTEAQMTGWGALGLKLRNLTAALERNGVREAVESRACSPGAIGSTVDEAVTELSGVDHLKLSQSSSDVCETVKNFDGESLRHREVSKCEKYLKPRIKPPPTKDPCKLFAWERGTLRREVPYIMGHTYTPSDEYDVTLVNHIDFNRLNLLERSFINWEGPSSVGIQVTESQAQKVVDYISNSELLRNRTNVTYHLQFRIGPSYPINPLRELGHKFASTPYVFYGDIDFVSSPDMYRVMRRNLREIGGLNKTAVVIPAFETDEKNFSYPRSKAEMVELMKVDTVRQFYFKGFPPGHKQTDYKKWTTATEPYYISWAYLFEPYTLLPTSSIPFDIRFVARFRNKVCHNAELHMAGYRFLVLSDAFIIHLPHEKNKQNMDALNKCDRKWYSDWIKEKKRQYNYSSKDVPVNYHP